MGSIVVASTASDRRRLTNPGGATTASAIGLAGSVAVVTSASTRAVAIARGGRRSGRASCIARFVARSPCSALAGRSTAMAGRSWSAGCAGSVPAASAAFQACSRASRTRARTVVGGLSMGRQSYRPGCRTARRGTATSDGDDVAVRPGRRRGDRRAANVGRRKNDVACTHHVRYDRAAPPRRPGPTVPPSVGPTSPGRSYPDGDAQHRFSDSFIWGPVGSGALGRSQRY